MGLLLLLGSCRLWVPKSLGRRRLWPVLQVGGASNTCHRRGTRLKLSEEKLKDWLRRLKTSCLTRGDLGEDVFVLQALLDSFGFDIAIDGDFGPQTESVCEDFQERRVILPDAVVGPQTQEELIYCRTKKWNLTESPFLHRSGVYVYGPKHPELGEIPATFTRMSTFGGPNDWGDLMYGQALVAARNPQELRRKYPKLIDLGLFREGIDELPRIKNPKTGKMVQTGLSWLLNPKSYFLAMRWTRAQRRLMVRDPSRYLVLVGVPSRDLWAIACPTDYGPAKWTGRGADISYGIADALATDKSGQIIDDGINLKTDSKIVLGWISNQVTLGPINRAKRWTLF